MYLCRSYNSANINKTLINIYNNLYKGFGPQEWWPSENDFETIIGAILTQSVSWTNVEKAISNLKDYSVKKDLGTNLNPSLIKDIDIEKLAELIKPSGYYNLKAKKLKSFVKFLFQNYDGGLEKMFKEDLKILRPKLLAVYGIGPETADSIMLYAGNYPTFVIDAYTKRIFSRIGLCSKDIEYHQLQKIFMEHLPYDTNIYNEYHALLVVLGKNICKKTRPDCSNCLLENS